MAEESRTPDKAHQAVHEAQEQRESDSVQTIPFDTTDTNKDVADDIVPNTLGVAEESVPDSPRSTISALLGQIPALEQESKTRTEAVNLHVEAQKKTRKHRSKKGKNKESDGSKSNFGKAWKIFAPGNKKQTEQHNTTTGNEYFAFNVQDYPASNNYNNWTEPHEGQPSQLGARPIFSPDATQEYFEQQLFQPTQPTYISSNLFSGEFTPSQESSGYFHHGFAPQPQYYQPMNQNNSSIILGGQIPHTSDGRIPSTYFTPTNTDNYAIAGRSRLVSGHPIVSQHAEFDTVTPYHHTSSPLTPLYPNTYQNTPYQQESNTMPRLPGSAKPVVRFTEDTKPPTESPPTAAIDSTEAITVGLSAGLALRESAIPPPLDVKKTIEPKTTEEGASTGAVKEGAAGKMKDEFTIAAFDGVHLHIEDERRELRAALERVEAKVNGVHQHVLRVGHDLSGVHAHLEDVRRETSARLDSLEEKLDRVLAAVSAGAVPAPAQQQKKQGRAGLGRESEVRGNLTGLPPHIPFGGMGGGLEGWYDQVKK